MPVEHPLYPVNLVVDGRPCLVVGGGRVAAGKVRGLLEAGAVVTVIAPEIDPAIAGLEGVAIERRAYRRGDIDGHRFVVAATGDPQINQAVYDDGEAAGVWVNAADDPARCSAILPARIRQGRLTVTISTGGHSPAVASWLKERLAAELGPEYDQLIGLLGEARKEVQAQGLGTEELDWRRALDSGILDLVRAGRLDAAKERLRACLSSSSD
ncbi:MAG TPA: bifunctional precorrin-2 dehydrogenase/sirohydrochlorin ferrochelatase [Acidimicrobiales bacterium]|nr:bifunctional precorrin-2 dehydrogenase/sirohydrochlorin ferrochelatase [Acidimicrobiales bacterium]